MPFLANIGTDTQVVIYQVVKDYIIRRKESRYLGVWKILSLKGEKISSGQIIYIPIFSDSILFYDFNLTPGQSCRILSNAKMVLILKSEFAG
jgi:hypothetical protein